MIPLVVLNRCGGWGQVVNDSGRCAWEGEIDCGRYEQVYPGVENQNQNVRIDTEEAGKDDSRVKKLAILGTTWTIIFALSSEAKAAWIFDICVLIEEEL